MDFPVTLIDLAGFIALLLWGAHMVQTGIQRTFGSKLRAILGEALKTRPMAFLAGMGVTAVLQCSTATHMDGFGICRWRICSQAMIVETHHAETGK